MKKLILSRLCLFIAIMAATVGAAVVLAMYIASHTIEGLSFSAMLLPFLPVPIAIIAVSLLLLLWAKKLSDKIMQPINDFDPDNPTGVYEELVLFMDKVYSQKVIRQEAETLRREFSANVSHELKTPLTTISGYAQMINSGIAKPEDYKTFTTKIEKEATRLLLLINDIIKLSNLDENNRMEKEPVDLPALTEECIERVSESASKKGIKIYYNSTPTKILANHTMITELVYNILDNAVKYNYENGKITVFAGEFLDYVKFIVKDTGIGIAKDEQERIFERFYRVDKSHSKTVGGTGLGLSIVKHAAICHDAKIEVKSELNKGTEISVLFPKMK